MSCECPTSELPGEAAAGEGLAAVVGLHPALCQAPRRAEELGPQFPQFLYLGAVTHSHSASRPVSPAFGVQTVRASCRLTQLRCWVVPGRDSSSSASSVRRVPSLHSSVSLRLVYTWPLFLHTSAGVNPAGSVPGVQEAARWAAGADSVGTSPPQTAPVLPHQRCWRHTSIRRSVPVREDRRTPRQRQYCTEGVCPPTAPVFVGVWEPKVSQPLHRQSPPRTHTARHPPWPRSTRFARSAPYGTGRLTAAAQGPRRNPRVCETASTIGHPDTHAQTSSQPRPASPARRTAKGFIYTPKEAAANAAAGCYQGDCDVAKSL